MKNADKKDWAKLLFLQGDMTQKEIAAKVDISEQTLCKWVKIDNWEHQRTSLIITKEAQLVLLYEQLALLNKNIKESDAGYATPSQADTLIKYSAAIKTLETDVSLAEIISVASRVINFIRGIDNEKAKEVAKYFDAFIKESAKKA
jgi:transposase-like protein